LISESYNVGLTGVVQQLGGLPGIDVRLLDVSQILNDVVTQPEVYGFSNATDACITPNQPPFTCATPNTYVFWDGIHPTRALHAIVAQRAIALISAP
jgi:phospholipase/lecithinase/hemolysin